MFIVRRPNLSIESKILVLILIYHPIPSMRCTVHDQKFVRSSTLELPWYYLGPASKFVHEMDGLSPNFGPLSTWAGGRSEDGRLLLGRPSVTLKFGSSFCYRLSDFWRYGQKCEKVSVEKPPTLWNYRLPFLTSSWPFHGWKLSYYVNICPSDGWLSMVKLSLVYRKPLL